MRTSLRRGETIHLPSGYPLLQLERPDVEPPVEKGTWILLLQRHKGFHLKNSTFQNYFFFFCVAKGIFGGLSSGFWGDAGLSAGVTAYRNWEVSDVRHCRDSSQGLEENGTRKLSLGYSDILPCESVWKGSNTIWDVNVAAVSTSHPL